MNRRIFRVYKTLSFASLALVGIFVLFTPQPVSAFEIVKEGIVPIVAWVVGDFFIPLVGSLMILVTNLVVSVSMYNSFATATAVNIAWVLIRDIANMFFVVALLLMAFGTMLGMGDKLGDYKDLPKFAIIAILVNFSKTITLFLIDIGQVVMLTFVAAFQSTAGGNFVKAFGIKDWFTLSSLNPGEDVAVQVLVAYGLAAVLVTVALVVLIIFLAFLVFRIAMLWVLIIFSPLAFALKLSKTRGEKYYGNWWDHLISTIIAGPLLAFFLWLTLLTAGTASGTIGGELLSDSAQVLEQQKAESQLVQGAAQGAGSSMLQADNMMTFVISIIMLLLGLKLTAEAGGVVGQLAVKRFPRIARRGVTRAGRFAWRAGARPVLGVAGKGVGAAGKGLYRMPLGRAGSLAGLVAGAKERARALPGVRVFADKERADLIREERKVRGMRAIGGERGRAEARTLEQGVISRWEDRMKKYSSDQLRSEFKKARPDSLQRKAVGLLLADRKQFKYDENSLLEIAGKDVDYKRDLIERANRAGSNIVHVDNEADRGIEVKNELDRMTVHKLQSFLGTIDTDAQQTITMSGKMETRGIDVDHVLGSLDEQRFNKLNDATQDRVRDALLVRMKSTEGEKRSKMVAQFNAFKKEGDADITVNNQGIVSDPAMQVKQSELLEAQQMKLSKEGANAQQLKLAGVISPERIQQAVEKEAQEAAKMQPTPGPEGMVAAGGEGGRKEMDNVVAFRNAASIKMESIRNELHKDIEKNRQAFGGDEKEQIRSAHGAIHTMTASAKMLSQTAKESGIKSDSELSKKVQEYTDKMNKISKSISAQRDGVQLSAQAENDRMQKLYAEWQKIMSDIQKS